MLQLISETSLCAMQLLPWERIKKMVCVGWQFFFIMPGGIRGFGEVVSVCSDSFVNSCTRKKRRKNILISANRVYSEFFYHIHKCKMHICVTLPLCHYVCSCICMRVSASENCKSFFFLFEIYALRCNKRIQNGNSSFFFYCCCCCCDLWNCVHVCNFLFFAKFKQKKINFFFAFEFFSSALINTYTHWGHACTLNAIEKILIPFEDRFM